MLRLRGIFGQRGADLGFVAFGELWSEDLLVPILWTPCDLSRGLQMCLPQRQNNEDRA